MIGTVVEDLLILTQIGRFCLVEVALQTGLGIKTIDACAMSRNSDRELIGDLTKV